MIDAARKHVEDGKPVFQKSKCITRRFTFDSKSLSILKAKASNSCDSDIPTRGQFLTSLIWKSFLATCFALSVVQKPSFVTHAVDLRRRASSTFPEPCIGNFSWSALAEWEDECGTKLHQLVGEIKRANNKVGAKFVKQLESEFGFTKYLEALKVQYADKEAKCLGFPSCSNLDHYNVISDGGKPAWASCIGSVPDPHSIFLNTVILMDTKVGDGIEARVYLGEQEMVIFERNREPLSSTLVHHGEDKLA